MKRSVQLLTALVASLQELHAGQIAVIPQPVSVQISEGFFSFNSQTRILYQAGAEAAEKEAVHLTEVLNPAVGFAYKARPFTGTAAPENAVVLSLSAQGGKDAPEGYALTVTAQRIMLRAQAGAGLFYGIQILRQLLPPEILSTSVRQDVAWKVPAVKIHDAPRFQWRGMLVDVARHFFTLAELKKFIDLISFYKMNRLQIHLTDDQGWRLQIRKYPRLTEIGSRRAESPLRGNRNRGDGTPYGPYFFTQREIRELVAYASRRYVTVVPEIEMPAHCRAALASYPRLGCTGGPYEVGTRWGGNRDLFCAGNEYTYEFLRGVLKEVAEPFPGPYLHIGGDEANMVRWKNCPKCRARMEKEHLRSLQELHSYFVRRIERNVRALGKRLIGWDEILQGGLAPNAIVMSWRGTRGGIIAARAGHEVVMCPTSHCYFDYYQSKDRAREPEAIGGYIPLERVYAFEPIPPGLSPEDARYILGAQANLWTEFIFDFPQLQYMAVPRLCALAEVVWSPRVEQRDFSRFKKRLVSHLRHLDCWGVRYRPLDR